MEISCALIQSIALIRKVQYSRYSPLEIAAAYLTVIDDAMLLIMEAVIVRSALKNIDSSALRINLFASIFTAICLGGAGIPIIYAKFFERKPLDPFKSFDNAEWLFAMAVIPTCSFAIFILLSFLPDLEYGIYKPFSLKLLVQAVMIRLLISCPMLVLHNECVSLTLGIRILKGDDNFSLAFLVISNMYPAIFTSISS